MITSSSSLREFPCVTHVILAYLREWWFEAAGREVVSACRGQVPGSTVFFLESESKMTKMQFFHYCTPGAYGRKSHRFNAYASWAAFSKNRQKKSKKCIISCFFIKSRPWGIGTKNPSKLGSMEGTASLYETVGLELTEAQTGFQRLPLNHLFKDAYVIKITHFSQLSLSK